MAIPSIHHQRRWFYVLWTVLLLLSLGALALWEKPVRNEVASLQILVTVRGAPAGTRVQAWAGPWKRWPGKAWAGEGAFGDLALPATGALSLPVARLAIARRRWNLGYIPRGTSDLVMLRVVPPAGPARYFALPCSMDIRTGALRSRYRLIESINISWDTLGIDANPPNRVP